MSKPDMLLWLNDARGVYLPQDFAGSFANRAKSVTGVDDKTWTILDAGPEHEQYWEAWEDVCNNAVITNDDGVEYFIHQDGDCWLVPKGMEWNDHEESFSWPKD